MPEQTPDLLDRLWKEIDPGQAPIVELVRARHACVRRRRRLSVVAAAAGSLCVASVVILGVDLAHTGDGGVGPSHGPTAERAGLPPEQAAARVLRSLGEPTVRDIRVIHEPLDPHGGLNWVRTYFTRSADGSAYRDWVSYLVEGSVAELMRTAQPTLAEVISGGDSVVAGPHGARVSTANGMGAQQGEYFDSPSDAALRGRVDMVAHDHGLTASSAKVLHPLDSALIVRLVVPSGHPTWTLDQLRAELLGSPVDIEGLFIELDSPTGTPLARIGWRERIGGGGGTFAPGQAVRFGIEG